MNRPSAQDNRALWPILAIVGGVLLVVALLCGGVVYLWFTILRAGSEMVKETQQNLVHFAGVARQEIEASLQAQQAARAFLDDCLAGRHNAAYAATTAAFRKAMTAAQFKDLLDQHPVRQRPPLTVADLQPIFGLRQYRHGANAPTGELVQFTVTMVQEGNTWKADQLAVDGPARPK